MTYHAARQGEPASVEKEISFSFEDLFFSRTNEKGWIVSGNSVFQKISLYPWSELMGKPHNIIRHQDMPRAVFWLLWDTIRKGEPIGAYVKNRAKDGRYYWVFAIVTHVEGGYLSVRLKPGGALFPVVEQEYKQLISQEQSRALKPAQSATLLLERLAQLGFSDYQAFMSTALAQEIVNRDQQLGRAADAAIPQFNVLGNAAQKLMQESERIFEAYHFSRYIPLNLRVQAAQLGEAAATIGVISVNYNIISNDIKNMMDSFIASAKQVFDAVERGRFLFCISKLQAEMLEQFQAETASDSSKQQETSYLEHQSITYQQGVADGLQAIARQVEFFHQACTQMKKLAAGLEVTRVMGKIESARLSADKNALTDLTSNLEQFQASIMNGLNEIEKGNRSIQRITQKLIDTAGREPVRRLFDYAAMVKERRTALPHMGEPGVPGASS